MEASSSNGVAHQFPVGREKLDTVIMGWTIRSVIRADEGNKVYLNLTVSQPTSGNFEADDVTVETKSIRILRKVEFGQAVTAKLKTGDSDAAFLEVTAVVREAKENVNGNPLKEAERDLKTAEFWLRTGHPDSASFYFELIRRKYPDTIYAERASQRLAKLRKQQSKAVESKEKPPDRVGQIFIVGNRKIGQEVILEQVPLYPGQVFMPDSLNFVGVELLSRVQGLKSVRVTVQNRDDESVYKDFRIEVEEK
jgi:hypothetical protein